MCVPIFFLVLGFGLLHLLLRCPSAAAARRPPRPPDSSSRNHPGLNVHSEPHLLHLRLQDEHLLPLQRRAPRGHAEAEAVEQGRKGRLRLHEGEGSARAVAAAWAAGSGAGGRARAAAGRERARILRCDDRKDKQPGTAAARGNTSRRRTSESRAPKLKGRNCRGTSFTSIGDPSIQRSGRNSSGRSNAPAEGSNGW